MKALHQKNEYKKQIAPALLRRLLLAWLTAAAGEFLLLPAGVRTMNGLQALAAMSLPRLLIVTGIVLALLDGISRLVDHRAERWMLAGIFAVLAAAALKAARTGQGWMKAQVLHYPFWLAALR